MAPQKAKKKLKRAINGRRPKLSHQEAQTDEELGAFLAHVSELSAATNSNEEIHVGRSTKHLHRQAILIEHVKKLNRQNTLLKSSVSKFAQIPNLIQAMKTHYETALTSIKADMDAMIFEQQNRQTSLVEYLRQHKIVTSKELDSLKKVIDCKEAKIRSLKADKKALSDQFELLQQAMQLEQRRVQVAKKEQMNALEEMAEIQQKMDDKLFLAGNQKCGTCQTRERVQEDLMNQIAEKHNTIIEQDRINQLLSNDLVKKRGELQDVRYAEKSYKSELVIKQGEISRLRQEIKQLEMSIKNANGNTSSGTTSNHATNQFIQNPNILTPPEEEPEAGIAGLENIPEKQLTTERDVNSVKPNQDGGTKMPTRQPVATSSASPKDAPSVTNNNNNTKLTDWVKHQTRQVAKRSTPQVISAKPIDQQQTNVKIGTPNSTIQNKGSPSVEVKPPEKRPRIGGEEILVLQKKVNQNMGEQKRKSTEDAEEGEVFSEAGSMKDFRQTQPPRRSESERLERQGWKEQPTLFKDAKTRGHMNHISPYLDPVDRVRPVAALPHDPWARPPPQPRHFVISSPPVQLRPPLRSPPVMGVNCRPALPSPPFASRPILPTIHPHPMPSPSSSSSPFVFRKCQGATINDFCEDLLPPPVVLDPIDRQSSSSWRRESFFMNRPSASHQAPQCLPPEIEQQLLRERVEQEIREHESRSVRPALPPQTALPPAYERQQQIFFPPKPMTPIPRPPERFQTPQRMPIYEQKIITTGGGILPWHNGLPPQQRVRPPQFFL